MLSDAGFVQASGRAAQSFCITQKHSDLKQRWLEEKGEKH